MNVTGVLLNVILLCVCFRPAKYSPHCAALHSDEDHYLDYLLVTVAVTGQQGLTLTPASSNLPSLSPCLGVMLHAVLPRGGPWHGQGAGEQQVCSSCSRAHLTRTCYLAINLLTMIVVGLPILLNIH